MKPEPGWLNRVESVKFEIFMIMAFRDDFPDAMTIGAGILSEWLPSIFS